MKRKNVEIEDNKRFKQNGVSKPGCPYLHTINRKLLDFDQKKVRFLTNILRLCRFVVLL